ncbi:hypothetical protein [Chryseobacterium sp. MFBS3-17]|uniref:hypothetical protein n=1 Tax=Chryseobacterium sp. MFBS3-17 TaxID=2886689 RepID=UPI001D0E0A5F|nr:hypothetical protein [Chryseobacterium sp. MFBS3-17]MCC2589618.1 hypothetical protein [Chryseobacterium sp. MFBS3-17]
MRNKLQIFGFIFLWIAAANNMLYSQTTSAQEITNMPEEPPMYQTNSDAIGSPATVSTDMYLAVLGVAALLLVIYFAKNLKRAHV